MRFTRQEGIRDCGICCLFNIIRFYGGYINIEKLRKMTNTNENGTSIYNIVKTSNEIGFKSKAYKCEINDLASLSFPLMLYIKLNNYNHFVILLDIDVDSINIFDPIRGNIKYSYSEFNKVWQGIIITFDKEKEIIKEEDYYVNYLKNIYYENKKVIISLTILSLVSTIFTIIFSSFIKKILDNKIKSYSFLLFTILLLFRTIIEYIKIKESIKLNNKVNYDLSSKVYKKIYSLPLTYHQNRPIGDITARINDLYSIESFLNSATLYFVVDALCILLILIIILFISLRIFLFIIFFTTLYIFIYYIFRNEEKKLLEDLKNNASISNSSLVENMIGINTVKNLCIEEKVINKEKENKLNFLKVARRQPLRESPG